MVTHGLSSLRRSLKRLKNDIFGPIGRRILILVNLTLILAIILVAVLTIRFTSSQGESRQTFVNSSVSCIQSVPPTPTTGIDVIRSPYSSEYIGVSDGRFAFDVDSKRPNAYLKCLGAGEFRQGDYDAAASHGTQAYQDYNAAGSFWTQAYQQESSDAEALIYRENARIAQLKLPHITFVIGTILTGDDAAIGRSVLQGAYAEQEEYNRNPDHTKQIRLLIANFSSAVKENLVSGPQIESEVADKIVAAAANDSTIEGLLMSIPFTSLTTISKLQNIPVVLSAGFSQQQIQGKTYIFPITPSAEREGQVAARYVIQQNKYHHVAIFIDQNLNDVRNTSLANSFSSQLAPGTIAATVPYTVGVPSTIQEGVVNLFKKYPDIDLIYFAGRSIDVDVLLLKLRQDNTIPVMGGADLYDLGGYSSNNYRNLYFTSFAFPDEWYTHQQHPFTALYRQLFAGWPLDKIYGYSRPSSDVLLAYDGMSVLVRGAELAGINNPFSVAKFIASLNSIAGTNAFQGFSGRISFGPDRFNKAVVMLSVGNTGLTNEVELDGCLLVLPAC